MKFLQYQLALFPKKNFFPSNSWNQSYKDIANKFGLNDGSLRSEQHVPPSHTLSTSRIEAFSDQSSILFRMSPTKIDIVMPSKDESLLKDMVNYLADSPEFKISEYKRMGLVAMLMHASEKEEANRIITKALFNEQHQALDNLDLKFLIPFTHAETTFECNKHVEILYAKAWGPENRVVDIDPGVGIKMDINTKDLPDYTFTKETLFKLIDSFSEMLTPEAIINTLNLELDTDGE